MRKRETSKIKRKKIKVKAEKETVLVGMKDRGVDREASIDGM